MDSFTPHPPNDLAVYMFISFSRAFFTSNQPIGFFKNVPQERLRHHAKLQSFRAQRILFDLYIYCQTTFASQPYQQTHITKAYLNSIVFWHWLPIKFIIRYSNKTVIIYNKTRCKCVMHYNKIAIKCSCAPELSLSDK